MTESRLRINDIYLDSGAFDHSGRYLNLRGGAGSGKSVFAADREILTAFSEPGHRILCVRKVAKTIRNSLYYLIRERLRDPEAIGLEAGIDYKIDRTNLGFTLHGNGGSSEILTSGLDDVAKLKSITGISRIWIEEATELSEEDFDQLDLRLRGSTVGDKQITLSYNPISRDHWIKARFWDQDVPGNLNVLSTYLDNAFIGPEYRDVLERLRDRNPRYYQVYALGEWGDLEEGLLFKREYLPEALFDDEELPADARGVIYCDPNLSKKGKGDTTGIAALMFAPSTQEYYLTDGACRSFSASSDLIDRVFSMYSDRLRTIGFDGNVSQGSTWREHIENYSRIRRVAVPLVEFKSYRVDEIAKNASMLWSEGRIRISRRFSRSEEGREFLSQLFVFAGKRNTPRGRNDDAPDSLICAVELIHERGLATRRAVADAYRKFM